ncbi:MAG TPA: hypothetical protein PLP65_04280 [Bacteroidales bacterium]|nr:hypothetical protein [Bacteroidales bacterium]
MLNWTRQYNELKRIAATNTGFASGKLTCKREGLCSYSASMQVDSAVLRPDVSECPPTFSLSSYVQFWASLNTLIIYV